MGMVSMGKLLLLVALVVSGAVLAPAAAGARDVEEEAWDLARKANTAAAYRAYLGAYPGGRFALAAGVALAGLEGEGPKAGPVRLSVKSTPGDARVRIMNIVPSYREGMELDAGDYDIEVSAPGYRSHRRTYALKAGDRVLEVVLEREAAQSATPTPLPSQEPAAGPIRTGRGAGEVFRDCPGCPEVVVIPAGSFQMGSDTGDPDERPVHRVSIGRAFALGRTEVTQGQWRAVMGSNPSHFSVCGDDCPVEQVSWSDAQEYLRKLSQKTGQSYRLPSEAQWEYACRAGGQYMYCGSNDVDAVAWYGGNSGRRPQPVGRKRANGFGLFDMSGNVLEWVEDCWNASYVGAPTDGSAWQSGDCNERVLRGGS